MPEEPKKFFNLGQDEQITREIKPESGLRWYFLLRDCGIAAVLLFLLLPVSFLRGFGSPLIGNLFFLIAAFIGVTLLIAAILAMLRYSKQYYWLTNKRVVYKRGLIGYRITSIPYERISDIIISRSFLEKLFGFGSLHVQTLAGQISGTHRMGAEGVLLAIPDPEGTQELIFELVRQKRRDENISF